MVLGRMPLVDDMTTAGRWHADSLSDVNNQDALWGYTIRAAGVLRQERNRSIQDTTLFRLLRLGIYDWTGVNVLGNQARQAIRWACPTIVRVLQRVWKVEKQVRPSVYIPCGNKTDSRINRSIVWRLITVVSSTTIPTC